MKKNPYNKFNLSFVLLFLFLFTLQGTANSQNETILSAPLKQCWSYVSEKGSFPENASDNETAIFQTYSLMSGQIEAIDISDGKLLWNSQLGDGKESKITADKSSVYILIAGKETENPPDESSPLITNTSLYALSTASGITKWKRSFVLAANTSFYTLEKSLILADSNGNLLAISKETGDKIWEIDLKREITSIKISDEAIVLGTLERKIFIISATNGSITKEFVVKEVPVDILLLNDETILWADQKGYLNKSQALNGDITWRRRFGAEISSLTETPKGIFISSVDNFVYFLNKSSGKILWKRRLAARVTEKPFIKDNTAVIFPFGESTALFVELNKGKIINTLTLSDANYFVSNPFYAKNLLVFPTLKGLYAFGSNCPPNEKTGK